MGGTLVGAGPGDRARIAVENDSQYRDPVSRRLLAAVLVAVMLAASCGSGPAPVASSRGTIVVTTDIWADVVASVACDAGTVVQLLPAGTDPHGFEASLADRQALDDAAMVVVNGLGLEGTLRDTLEAVDVAVFAMAEHVDTIPLLGGGADGNGEGDDPHVWLDPRRVASAIPALVDALDSAGFARATVEPCATEYIRRLTTLDAAIAARVESVPAARRNLVTSHESLGYFADRYGFTVLGAVIEGGSSLGGANPAALAALVDAIDSADVPAVFTDPQVSSDDAEALASTAGVAVVAVPVESLTAEAPSYVELLGVVTERIVTALTS
jgi:zinc/manganese transport system substrate-binding protein